VSITSLSLLERLKRQPSDSDWERFHDIYRPLIRGWLARVPDLRAEVEDLTHETMVIVFRELGGFERQREGSFRAWLRRITVYRVRGYWRTRAKQPRVGLDGSAMETFLGQLEDPSSDLAAQWDRDHDRHVFDQLLGQVRTDFSERSWEAFRRFAIEDRPAAVVAAELGMTVNAVLLVKSRVLKRLREEAGVLLD
jgi:RNA polymerase sigma-70 factor (ECF subfamily)